MEKKKRVKKRTRLIALLSALATLAVGGIGTGLAFSAMAATKSSSVSSASSSKGEKASLFEKGMKEQKFSPSQEKAVLASISPENGGGINGYYSAFPGSTFQASIGVQGGLSSSLTSGQWVNGSVWVPEGVDLALFGPNFAMPNGTYENPNTLNRDQLLKLMEGGGYVGAVTVQNSSNMVIPLMGLVSSSGRPWTESQIKNAGISSTGTIQNEFMSKCMGYQWIPVSASNPGGPKKDETVQLPASQGAAGIVADGVLGVATPSTALPDIKTGLQRLGYTGTKLNDALQDIETVFTDPKVTSFQTAFMKWYNDKTSDQYLQDAVSAAQDLLKGDFGTQFKKELPIVCEAVWNGAVQFNEYENGNAVETGEWQDLYTPGNDLNGNSTNQYVSNFATSGFGPDIAGCGQNTTGCGIKVSVDALGCAFVYDTVGTDFTVTASYFVSTQKTSSSSSLPDPAYSDPGALVQNSLDVDGNALNNNFFVRQTGTSPMLFNPTSVDSTFSPTSTPATSGLWFKAVDQQGEPLKQVKVLLIPLSSPNSAAASQLAASGGEPMDPYPWTGPGFKGDSYKGIGQLSSDLSSGSTTSNAGGGLIGYLWYGQSGATTSSDYALIPLNQVSGQNGVFEISGLPFGVYRVDLVSGENQEGQTEEYGSYYTAPSFQVSLNSYSSSSTPEKMSAIQDPCGFVDPAEDLVVVGATNPSSAKVSGTSLSTSTFTATVGSQNPYTYQAEAYLPFDLSGEKNSSGTSASSAPLTLSLSIPGQGVIQGSVKANGVLLSSLSGASVSVSSSSPNLKVTLSPSALSSIESQGEAPVGSSGSLTQNGEVNHTLAITWEAYLEPSFTSSSSSTFEFDYEAYSTVNPNDKTLALTPEVETNGPADNSVPSSLTTSTPSSSTGLWFKDLNADGSASKGAKFLIQNSSGQYLEEDKSSSGAFSGWSWTSSASSALEFSQRNADAVFSFGGLADGTYTVTQVAWPDSVGTSGKENTGEQNWPGISPDLPAGGKEGAGYPGHLGGKAGYDGSFQVTLSYSSPEAMTTQADPAGLVDTSEDQIYALSPVKMAPLVGGSLSSQAYQTETVGIPFTEGWEGYLPMAVTSPTSSAGQNGYASELTVSFPEKGSYLNNDSGLNNNGNSSGLEMSNPSTSNIEVAGIPLSTLVSNGAAVSPSNSDYYSISLPYKALEYLEENGKNAEGESLSSSSNRLIIISFPAVMGTSFKNGGQFQQWMALGSGWWNQNAGSGWGVYSSPLYTNGQADNSVPSSLSPSENSSNTGIWFKSLWYGTSTPATGSKYTVQNASGKYLAPQESSDGTFEGWSWTSSPYDFSEQNPSAVFSFGGLSDGTYTLTQVDPAKGATASTLSFTSTLSYPSPQNLKAVKDSLNLLDSSKDTVWAIAVPSSLPFTGGKMILLVSLSAVVLFGAGALFFILRKRRRA